MMNFNKWLLLLLAILGACICGGGTSKCTDSYRMSLLTDIHDDPSCSIFSHQGIMLSEAADYFIKTHNNRSEKKVDLSILDTCGTITGATKAMMKALESDDFTCTDPPFLLGLIGPESAKNIDAVQKITSVLSIPHIIKTNSVSSPYLHYLHVESDVYIVQGILEVIEALRWKSFTLATRKHNGNEDDVQLIAKKVTMGAITRGLCVMIHEQDDDIFTSHIVYIGRPPIDAFKNVNGTIIIVSEGNLKTHVEKLDTRNPVIYLQDVRNDVSGVETQVENLKRTVNQQQSSNYDPENTRELRWLENAIEIYTKTLDILCMKSQCTREINHAEWNTLIASVVATRNSQLDISTRTFGIYMKAENKKFDKLGEIKTRKNDAAIYWVTDDSTDTSYNIVPEIFKNILLQGDEKTSRCATSENVDKTNNNSNDDDNVEKISFIDIDDHEFWTMIGIVGGIGVTMFTIGVLAVYVVYTNIRGPRSPKQKRDRQVNRDESIRRVGSDRELQIVTGSPQRPPRPNPRRDSSRSIRSIVSDKSV